jgi:hypothetical protein
MRARTAEGIRAETAARELLASGNPDYLPPPRPRHVYLPTEVKEVSCLHCGELSGELQVQRAPDGQQARFVLAAGAAPPRRGHGNRPRCGRCNGDLFIHAAESRTLPPFRPITAPAPVRGAA